MTYKNNKVNLAFIKTTDWKYQFGPGRVKLALVCFAAQLCQWVSPGADQSICLSGLFRSALCQIPENTSNPVTFWGWTNDLLGLRWGQFIFCLWECNVIVIKSKRKMHTINALIILSLWLVPLPFDMIEEWVRKKKTYLYRHRHITRPLCWLLISLQ